MDEIDDLGRSAGREARKRGQRLAPLVHLDTDQRMGNDMNKRTAWIAAAAAAVLIVAGFVAVASVKGNESVQTASTTEPAPLPSTTSPAATETTAKSEPTQTTEVTTTTVSTTEAPSTVEPPEQIALEQPPIWPAADVVFDTPQDAARDFVASVLGVDPVLGEFRELDARSGEIEAQSNADAPPGTTFPRALLQLRQLRPTDGWYVISATSDGASISLPTAGAEVPAGPLTVEGEGRGFESTLNVVAFIAGPEYSDLDVVIASGGAFGQNEPYRATVDLSQALPGDVVTILVRGDTGLSEDPGEFAAIPVVIAPQTTAVTPQPDPTRTTPTANDPARSLVAITAEGDAVYFDAADANRVLLLDGADPNTIDDAQEGPGPNLVDSVAVSSKNNTGFVGECCEPVSGIVYTTTLATPVDKDAARGSLQGYGVSVSPSGDLLAVGNFAGIDVGINVIDIATGVETTYRSDPQTPFSPYETMWADQSTVVVLGIGNSGWELAVFDIAEPSSAAPRIIPLPSSNGINSQLSLAGRPDSEAIGIYEIGGTEVFLVDVLAEDEPVLTAAAILLPGPALSAWFYDPGQLIWVDVNRTLRVGDEVIPGEYTWARR